MCTHWIFKEYVNDHDQDMLDIRVYISFEETSPFNLISPLVISHSKNELLTFFSLYKESAEFLIIERENDNIDTDSHEPKKIHNTTKNDNDDNRLKEIISIINKMQFLRKKQFRKSIIDDTELHGSNGVICGSNTNSNQTESGLFSIFNNIFCSNA